MAYPLDPYWLGGVLAAYAIVLLMRPHFWLFVIPAVLPLANLVPWSGWLFVEELDFFILVTVAVGYWMLLPKPPVLKLSVIPALFLLLLTISYGVSTAIGLLPLQPIDANAFSNYMSHYNSLRILKPFVWALLLLPLLRRSLTPDNVKKLFIPGVLTGLAAATLVVFWERQAFTGLMDFASDYRVTGSFPEMHVGGAALDAYLALTLPFAMVWMLKGRGAIAHIAGAVLLAAASYAALVTFSRGLYLGYAVSAVVLALVLVFGTGKQSHLKVLPMTLILTGIAVLMTVTFGTGGYRGLFAAGAVFAATFFIGGVKQQVSSKAAAAALTLVLAGASVALYLAEAKGAYFAFGLSLALFGLGFLLASLGRRRSLGMTLAYAGYFGMLWSDIAVNWHWGGETAAVFGGAVVALSIALVLINRMISRPVWLWNGLSAMPLVMVLMLLALITPILGNPYMSQRIESAGSDINYRSDHWQDVIAMVEPDWLNQIFGMGLGRFPENYFWKNKKQDFPGVYRIESEGGQPFLRLEGPKYNLGYGESLRYGQRINIEPSKTYSLEFDARTTFTDTPLHAEICEKYLIYFISNCAVVDRGLNFDGEWHHYQAELKSQQMGSEPWYERPTFQFSLSTERAGGFLDVKNVILGDGTGTNLIENGNFMRGSDRWFFSSDHYHLPWHAKDLGLDVYFDQGLFGLTAFCLLVVSILLRLMVKALQGDIFTATLLASLMGFLMVGLFDSILDFPRLSLLFYLLIFVAALREIKRSPPDKLAPQPVPDQS
jgi:hypothetical protein